MKLLGCHEDGRILFQDDKRLRMTSPPYDMHAIKDLAGGPEEHAGAKAVLQEPGWSAAEETFGTFKYMVYRRGRWPSDSSPETRWKPYDSDHGAAGLRIIQVMAWTLAGCFLCLLGIWITPYAWRILTYFRPETRFMVLLGILFWLGWMLLIPSSEDEEHQAQREYELVHSSAIRIQGPDVVAGGLVFASVLLWALLMTLLDWIAPRVVSDLYACFNRIVLLCVPPIGASLLAFWQYTQYMELAAQRQETWSLSPSQLRIRGLGGGLIGLFWLLLYAATSKNRADWTVDATFWVDAVFWVDAILVGLFIAVFKVPSWVRRKRTARFEQAKGSLSLTCQECKQLAEPIRGSGDRYRCSHCGGQFAGAKHGW